MSKRIFSYLLVIVALRFVVMFLLHTHTYWTFDEPWNTDVAKKTIALGHFDRTKDSFVPISLVNVYGGQKLMELFPRVEDLLLYRVFSWIFNSLAVFFLFLLAIELGATETMALAFSAILSFEPTVLHHSTLTGNVDGHIFTWMVILAWSAIRWSSQKSLSRIALFGLILGLAQGIKLTSAYFVPLCLIWVLWELRKLSKRQMVSGLFIFLAASWLGLGLIYGFDRLGVPLGNIKLSSSLFQKLASKFPHLPTFIPVDYLQGLDQCLARDQIQETNVVIFQKYYKHGVWYYFLYALLVKVPLPLLITAILGWVQRIRQAPLTAKEGFFILMGSTLLAYFSLVHNSQIGIRYLLPIYPFLFAGILWFPWTRSLVIASLVWSMASMGYNWPNYIGYFNELVAAKHLRWKHLADSNLAWNNDWKDWPNFVNSRKYKWENMGPATLPINEVFFFDANTLSGVLWNPQELATLREHFEPKLSFWGIQVGYFVTPQELFSAFPIQKEIPNLELKGKFKCQKEGWMTNTSTPTNDITKLTLKSPGPQTFQAKFYLAEKGPVNFQIRRDGNSTVFLNGEEILKSPDGQKRLLIETYLLHAGLHRMQISVSPPYPDSYFGFRATALAQSLKICLP